MTLIDVITNRFSLAWNHPWHTGESSVLRQQAKDYFDTCLDNEKINKIQELASRQDYAKVEQMLRNNFSFAPIPNRSKFDRDLENSLTEHYACHFFRELGSSNGIAAGRLLRAYCNYLAPRIAKQTFHAVPSFLRHIISRQDFEQQALTYANSLNPVDFRIDPTLTRCIESKIEGRLRNYINRARVFRPESFSHTLFHQGDKCVVACDELANYDPQIDWRFLYSRFPKVYPQPTPGRNYPDPTSEQAQEIARLYNYGPNSQVPLTSEGVIEKLEKIVERVRRNEARCIEVPLQSENYSDDEDDSTHDFNPYLCTDTALINNISNNNLSWRLRAMAKIYYGLVPKLTQEQIGAIFEIRQDAVSDHLTDFRIKLAELHISQEIKSALAIEKNARLLKEIKELLINHYSQHYIDMLMQLRNHYPDKSATDLIPLFRRLIDDDLNQDCPPEARISLEGCADRESIDRKLYTFIQRRL